jgi:acyl carrier protein
MIFQTIKDILLELGIDEEYIHTNAYLRKDLQLDSSEIVQIALDLKRRCGVTLKFESRQDLTLADVCALADHAKMENPS